MRPILISALLMAVSFATPAQTVKPHDIEDFIREDKFKSIQVSPKGTYIAITVPVEDKTVLYVLRPGDKQPFTRVNVSAKKSHIFNVTWVSDERLIYEVGVKDQLIETPLATGELFAINADGSRTKQLAGYIRDDGISGRSVSKETVGMAVITRYPTTTSTSSHRCTTVAQISPRLNGLTSTTAPACACRKHR